MIWPLLAAIAVAATTPAWEPDGIPYEMTRAGRTNDLHRPLISFDGTCGWRAEASNGTARAAASTAHRLFGKASLQLVYRAPYVRLVPPEPVGLDKGVDTVSVWVYGDNLTGMLNGRKVSVPRIYGVFEDAAGKRERREIERVDHAEWFCSVTTLPRPYARLVAMELEGAADEKEREIFITSFCAYRASGEPLVFAPRSRRGVQLFPDQPQGVNTGSGRLPFPNSPRTILPPETAPDERLEFRLPRKPAESWDDLAFRWKGGKWMRLAAGGGVYPLPARGRGEVKFRREGNSLIAEVAVKGGTVQEVRFGSMPDIDIIDAVPVPYLNYRMGYRQRPLVLAFREGGDALFVSAQADWTQSSASEPVAPETNLTAKAANGAMRYGPRTDGRRNDAYERFVWTVSPDFAAVLPTIPNPPSPWKRVTGSGVWRAYASTDHAADTEFWRKRRRLGLDRLIITDHETMWRDGEESFTFRTETAPGRGGDEAHLKFTRTMIDELGYVYGPYNNFTDLATVNGWWHPDRVARTWNGQYRRAWRRCYCPKPLVAVEACDELAPAIQRKFGFNTAYCDVHTAKTPWSCEDYDARVPGAATFAQTFYAYGEILLRQREAWGGPVYSEGGIHWLYSGLADGNYAQDREYGLSEHPWFVDFDLMRMHPLSCNFGMGSPSMFYGGRQPGDPEVAMDRFLAATVAFGHPGFLMSGDTEELQSYFMIQAVAERYTQADAAEIRYADREGRLMGTAEAIVTGAYRENRIAVRYSDGTEVFVNGGGTNSPVFACDTGLGRIVLPPNGFCVTTGDGRARSVSALLNGGRRADIAIADGYAYINARGKRYVCEAGATDGVLARVRISEYEENVVSRKAAAVELPYVSESIEGFDERGKSLGAIAFEARDGKTIFRPDARCWNYRVKRARETPFAFDANPSRGLMVPLTTSH